MILERGTSHSHVDTTRIVIWCVFLGIWFFEVWAQILLPQGDSPTTPKKFLSFNIFKFDVIWQRWMSIEWWSVASGSITLGSWDIRNFLKSSLLFPFDVWMIAKFFIFWKSQNIQKRKRFSDHWSSYHESPTTTSRYMVIQNLGQNFPWDHVQGFLNFWVSEIWYHLVEMDTGRVMVYCKWPDRSHFSRYLDLLFFYFAWTFLMIFVEKNQTQKFFKFSFSLIERGSQNSINNPIEKTLSSFVSKIWIFSTISFFGPFFQEIWLSTNCLSFERRVDDNNNGPIPIVISLLISEISMFKAAHHFFPSLNTLQTSRNFEFLTFINLMSSKWYKWNESGGELQMMRLLLVLEIFYFQSFPFSSVSLLTLNLIDFSQSNFREKKMQLDE